MKEGIYTMDELKRITIIQSVVDKKRTQKEAATALKILDRQIRKILKRYKREGSEGIKHKNKLHKPAHAFYNNFKQNIIKFSFIFSNFKNCLKSFACILMNANDLRTNTNQRKDIRS